jgi:hypothetical protein
MKKFYTKLLSKHGNSRYFSSKDLFIDSSFQGMGVFRENELDDIDVMVQNFTAPALARALREKERALQRAAALCQAGCCAELRAALEPHLRSSIERKRLKKHNIDLSEKSPGLTKKELVIIQRYLNRMPRHVSTPEGEYLSSVCFSRVITITSQESECGYPLV